MGLFIPWIYFVTICTRDQECFFASLRNGKVELSHKGKMAEKYWLEISEHFNGVELDVFVIMPNHVHGIVIIDSHDGNARFRRPCRNAINRASTS